MAVAYHHVTRAQAAAMFGDADALDRHSAAAMPVLNFVEAAYSTSRAHLLRALAVAEKVRGGAGYAMAELDACREWLARRATDAPGTFGHLVRLVDAERAWAAGNAHQAAVAFDAALDEVANRRRPWHHALTAERAAAFHLAGGTQHTARQLLAEAVRVWRAWGATAKVRQLEETYPFLRGIAAGDNARRSDGATTTRVSMESIDMLAVLKASQALSSETNLDRLRARVVEVLRTLTGASIVRILLRGDTSGWSLFDDTSGLMIPVADAGAALPLTAFRYAERTRTPLLVEDATHDDRFARDPYVASLDRCSLLAVPILSQGDARAMVMLENRLSRNAFTVDRLDAVLLIAGQLAVSLDNARLYASLERKVAERTEELEVANKQLQQLSITDPLTGLANRRQLGDLLAAEWQRALGTGGQVAVAMIDVDHFKLYNDHYGHLAGDHCLRKVAGAIGETVRGNDLVARYGGEEFAIVLIGEDLPAAVRVAERVRAAVEALGEEHTRSSTGQVTVSIGVASVVPTPGTTPEDLIAAADERLYQAKNGGRNRVA
jgi:diguanylate cyclase (GGDEF)-like protein